MPSTKQRQAAKSNIRKAQKTWRSMSSAARARSQPEGRGRQKPGTTGKGEFYHVEVRPKTEFAAFRVQDVGKKHGIERVAGRRGNGSWDTQKWLISKEDAHVEDGELVPDSATNPRRIANSLKRSAERSKRRKATPYQSAMSMLNFYINRAGKSLSKRQRGILERAKSELRKTFGRK